MSQSRHTDLIPERIWFVNTDMHSFHEFARAPGDASPFAHWVRAGRLFVTPRLEKPNKYNNALLDLEPGDPVFAYEDQVGIVGLGTIAASKDLSTAAGGTALYPNPAEIVRSVAVEWDTTITRTMAEVREHTIVTGQGLRRSHPGSPLHRMLAALLREVVDRDDVDLDALEAAALEAISSDAGIDAVTRASVIAARIGQGTFRTRVYAREGRCRVTGITERGCLVASHIKPWALCAAGEHRDGANGLMLSPHADLLFDTGLISFTNDGQLLIAPTCDHSVLRAWRIDPALSVGPFAADQAAYLAFHRRFVFGQGRPRRRRNVIGELPAARRADLALIPGSPGDPETPSA